MMHGPCQGRPCWLGKGCKLGYPKPFAERTVIVEGAYPTYKRQNMGISVVKNGVTFDNGHVVPYNKFLSLMFQCHINVEIPLSTTAVKYIYKYITKGHDRSLLKIEGSDEIKAFIDGRYLSPPECKLLTINVTSKYIYQMLTLILYRYFSGVSSNLLSRIGPRLLHN
jgi:hypothetical protein